MYELEISNCELVSEVIDNPRALPRTCPFAALLSRNVAPSINNAFPSADAIALILDSITADVLVAEAFHIGHEIA